MIAIRAEYAPSVCLDKEVQRTIVYDPVWSRQSILFRAAGRSIFEAGAHADAAKTPFYNEPASDQDKEYVWLAPELVAEVSFLEWTQSREVRHPVFFALREDKPARAVIAEPMIDVDSNKTLGGNPGSTQTFSTNYWLDQIRVYEARSKIRPHHSPVVHARTRSYVNSLARQDLLSCSLYAGVAGENSSYPHHVLSTSPCM